MRRASARDVRRWSESTPAYDRASGLRRGAALPALATAVAVFAALLVAAAAPSAQANVCVLAPVLRDTSVSQGIGTTSTGSGYRLLRRGKTTVVKAFLSKPQCAAATDRVKIRSATLQVGFPGRTSTEVANVVTGPEYPELLAYTAAPALNAASDPLFSVPGSVLDGSGTGQAAAAFTVTVQWEATSSLGAPSGGLVVLRPGGALTGPTATATFERPSYSPRLLIVPMGDPTRGFTTNWPDRSSATSADGADDVLLRALHAVSRLAPFKDGVTTDLLGTEGLRYAVAPTILDVRSAIRADGKFCGTGANFSYVRGQLSSFLNNWQAENSTTTVDKVLGVVWGPNSTGPETDTACADGYASIGGNQAWSRLQADRVGAPGRAGNLMAMETIGHNFGSVPSIRSASGDAYHSVLTADAGTRGVNTATREPIANALSVLKYSLTGWNDYTTLLRQEDWIYTLCRLTPSSNDLCPVEQIHPSNNTTPLGAPAGLAASVYTIAGKTDGTLSGTDFDTYLATSTDLTDPSSSSEYRLVQRGVDGSNEPILSTTPFPVDFRTSEHHGGTAHDHPTAAVGTAEVRFAAADGAQIFEVYNGDPRRTRPIYRRMRDGAPVLGPATVAPGVGTLVNQTQDTAGGGSLPALSPNGSILAYTSPTGIVLKNLATGTRGAAFAGEAASWVDDRTLAFVRSGNLYVGTVTSGQSPTVTSPRTVYDSSRQVELFFAPAGRPTADPADTADAEQDGDRHLVTAINGDLWRIDLEDALLSPTGVTCQLAAGALAPCYRLTSDAATDGEPAYESADRVLFTRNGTVRALDVASRQVHPTARIEAAGQPSAAAPFIAYTRAGGGLGLADSTSLAVVKAALTSADDRSASLVGRALAFARTSGSRTDVLTTRLQTNTLTFTATDASAALLRAGVYVTCDGIDYPVFVAAPPSSVSGDVATWVLEWDGAGSACTQPELFAVISDGIDAVRVDLGTGYGPASPRTGLAGALYSPAPGSTVLQYDTPALLGDVPGVPAQELSWRVTGPSYDQVLAFRRGEPALAMPPSGGWRPGASYVVELRRADAVRASGAFTVLEDADHDNMPRLVEERCFGPGADNDPTNAGGDLDADGDRNVSDSDPCSSSLNVTVDLDANTLNSAAKGNSVTFYLTSSAVDLRSVPMSTVAVTRIGEYEAHLPATAYENVTATSATVKVSRQDLQSFVAAQGLTGYVPVVLSGSGSAGSFRGLDPADPKFS